MLSFRIQIRQPTAVSSGSSQASVGEISQRYYSSQLAMRTFVIFRYQGWPECGNNANTAVDCSTLASDTLAVCDSDQSSLIMN
jgi:hypothetical protein